MKRIGLIIVTLLFFIAAPVFALQIPKTHLVSAEWLAKNMNNSHLVIVDVRAPKAYESGHIPHAVNVPTVTLLQTLIKNSHLIGFITAPDKIIPMFRKAGISNNSIIVFYSNNNNSTGYSAATRALWTAYYYGVRKVLLLHGGINAWVANHKPLSKRTTIPKEGKFTIRHINLNAIATWPYVDAAYSAHQFVLIDARPLGQYEGKYNDPRLIRYGHIPGAHEVFLANFSKKVNGYYELVNTDEARNILSKANVNLHRPIITYCNTGWWASADWFVVKFIAGAKRVYNYDGSMVEYSRLINRPLNRR